MHFQFWVSQRYKTQWEVCKTKQHQPKLMLQELHPNYIQINAHLHLDISSENISIDQSIKTNFNEF